MQKLPSRRTNSFVIFSHNFHLPLTLSVKILEILVVFTPELVFQFQCLFFNFPFHLHLQYVSFAEAHCPFFFIFFPLFLYVIYVVKNILLFFIFSFTLYREEPLYYMQSYFMMMMMMMMIIIIIIIVIIIIIIIIIPQDQEILG